MAREPCQTFARWVGGEDERGWVKRLAAAGRPGAYLRVLKTGIVRAGDAIEVVPAEDLSAPTMAEFLASIYA